MGSSNGTVLNGVELEEEGDPVPLADGDVLIIGTDTTANVKVIYKKIPSSLLLLPFAPAFTTRQM